MGASSHVRAESPKFAEFWTHIKMLTEGRPVPFTRLSEVIYTVTDRDLTDGCTPRAVQGFHERFMNPPLYNSAVGSVPMGDRLA